MSTHPTRHIHLGVQTLLDLTPLKEKEIQGIGMGVLPDGTSYLTGRGLAAMCGIGETTLRDMINNWDAEKLTPRGLKITELLSAQGYNDKALFKPVNVNGSRHHAYPEVVCMAFLEYFAFDAAPVREQALKNYRLLAKSSLRAFIYVQIGYDPTNRIPEAWQQFHDRVSLVHPKVPAGYFCIFKEMADLTVAMILGGVPVGEHTVPDGSVGIHWAKAWAAEKLEEKYGKRIPYEHNYPEYFPQAKSNPQHPWAYPDGALPRFREWMRETYLPQKFPPYIQSVEKKHALPPSITNLILAAVVPAGIKGQ